ncbi:MAG: cation diffusion facilitator family transporter, partial [Candidatus Methanoplasma sp.]|nr:cation diffusion facilitator family transporter [Candidatus Methanoplasma sp.]
GAVIIFEAVRRLMRPEPIDSLDIGLALVLLAAAVNYVMGIGAIKRGKATRSIALESSGKHLCTDTYSSIGITIGLAMVYGSKLMGYDIPWLDPLVALLFGALITITGGKVMRKAMDDIMDKADESILSQIVDCLNEHRSEDWIDIHNLRAVKYGSKMHVEMHTTLPFDMTIKQEEEQKKCLFEAVVSLFGDSVDLIMMPEPCQQFSCPHCSRECPARRAKFVGHVIWNIENLSQDRQHAFGHRVLIGDINTEK